MRNVEWRAAMKTALEKVTPEQKHILGNLLEYYVYEFSREDQYKNLITEAKPNEI